MTKTTPKKIRPSIFTEKVLTISFQGDLETSAPWSFGDDVSGTPGQMVGPVTLGPAGAACPDGVTVVEVGSFSAEANGTVGILAGNRGKYHALNSKLSLNLS